MKAAAEVLDLNESLRRPASFSFTVRFRTPDRCHCMLLGGGGRHYCTAFSEGLVSNNTFKWSSIAVPLSFVYSGVLFDFNHTAVLHSANQEMYDVHFMVSESFGRELVFKKPLT